jgi:protein-S-isoprenylcysteine O-methyltransferase Ste14
METETIFRILLPALLVAFIVHRGYYTKKYRESASDTLKKREEGPAAKLAGLLGMVGFISIIAYVINPGWLSWAALPLPLWLRWAGVGVALTGFALLQWAQNTLGKSWSDTPRMIKEQALVTAGPYKFIRHPIYTAFLLILGSTLLISSNWLIGLAFVAMTALEIASRIGFEEALMVEYFGDQYRDYVKKTGRLFPRLIK